MWKRFPWRRSSLRSRPTQPRRSACSPCSRQCSARPADGDAGRHHSDGADAAHQQAPRGPSRTNGVLESRKMRLRIVGSCRGYGKFPEISPPEQSWHISQNILRNAHLPQQTDAQYVRRVGSSISGGAGQAAAGQECLDSLKGRQLHLRCTARRSSGRLPVEEYERRRHQGAVGGQNDRGIGCDATRW